ncbi:tRNA 2-thiouridine(34) synthase MnmA [Gordonibacter sp. An230]|uniref:tRNA 2-thiouridine(34) synthase MnmA n=1 Tax=Gordonibacter sp. An230 TaxID=1965592 RepID=UPI000B3663CD|nr:tRNA 2-thiouridine(34) synthase MnmA [Gordonibacter sp. An230]OUO89021.1 tRNA 2-thiouridine(34) synthase MnmA [Gordonibacter sp. An230]
MAREGRIALGMSGGVDSAVSAALLMRAGYEVVGVTCRFHDGEASDAAASDAAAVCERLGIAHVERDCSDAFERRVVVPFVESYACGFTPSPCIGCNASCKLPELLEVASELGCDQVATGHYARIARYQATGRFVVKTALDARKDQSYMLALLSQEQLARLVLPLGAITKAEVRVIAADLRLPVAEKPESQDNCFVEGDYRDFLRNRCVASESGDVVDRKGRILGRHTGLPNYTVGQRKGIGIAAAKPYYVVGKDIALNRLVVGFANEALMKAVHVGDVNWQALDGLIEPREAMGKLRYRSSAAPCIIEPEGGRRVRIVLREAQPMTAPGQYAVMYEGDTVLGGGMIEEVEQA